MSERDEVKKAFKELKRLRQRLADRTSTPLPAWWGEDHPDAFKAAFIYAAHHIRHESRKFISHSLGITEGEMRRLLRWAEEREVRWQAEHERAVTRRADEPLDNFAR